MDAPVQRGRIKRWFSDQGYGFISRDTGGDLFSHISSHCGHLKYAVSRFDSDVVGVVCYFTEVTAARGPKTDLVCCVQCFKAATDMVVDAAVRDVAASAMSDRLRSLFEPGIRLDLGGKNPYLYRFNKDHPAEDLVLREFENAVMRAVLDGLTDTEIIERGTEAARIMFKKLQFQPPAAKGDPR